MSVITRIRAREILDNRGNPTVEVNAETWTDTPPQCANFRAWAEIIGNDLLPGATNKERRGDIKGALKSAWTFTK